MSGSASQVQLRRDNAANVAAYTGPQGEVIADTTNNRLCLQDGVTAGGWALAKLAEVSTANRTTVADANYTILPTDRIVAYTAISAARQATLPAASAFPVGQLLSIVDESGACSSSKYISINAAGADKINGASNFALTGPYMAAAFESNGVNGWGVIAGSPNLGVAQIGVGTGPDPNNPLSVKGSTALFSALSANFTLCMNKTAAGNTASILFEDNWAGKAQIGLVGDDNLHLQMNNGSTWVDAVNINAAGQATFPQGVVAGDRMGFRNRLRNGSFAINQRAVSGTVTLSAGVYGHDGVKAGAGGATYTFATTGIDTILTISAGSLILPIENLMIEGGAYTLAHDGTAQARVWQGAGNNGSGSYAAATRMSGGLAVGNLSAATQTNVEFSTGTVLCPQLEPGAVATAFERRPFGIELVTCQRYFWSSFINAAPGTPTGAGRFVSWLTLLSGYATSNILAFPTPFRATPTITFYSPATGAAGYAHIQNQNIDVPVFPSFASLSACMCGVNNTLTNTNDYMLVQVTASAEI